MSESRRIWNKGAWVTIPAEHRGWFAARQVRAFHGLARVNTYFTLGFWVLTLGVVLATGFSLVQGLALTAVILVCVWRQVRAAQVARVGVKAIDAEREIGWITRHSALFGIAVAASVVSTLILPLSDRPSLAALVIVAIMLAGSWGIDMVPRAAIYFLIAVGGGSVAAFLWVGTSIAFVTALIIAAFFVGFVGHCYVSFNSFAMRLLRAKEVERAGDTVRLLLNDFEEHGADWLWEVDSTGRIVNPSARFAEVAGCEVGELAGAPLVSLFEQGHDREILESLIGRGQSFHDMVVRVARESEELWWSLSGRVVRDGDDAVTGMRGVATDVSAAKRAEAQVAYMAHYDVLTDLPNRRFFNETLGRSLARRKDGQVSVVYLDLDHFKVVNDTLGHAIGDEVLKIAAQRIEAQLGAHDMVARLGGDEFAILLCDFSTPAEAVALGERIVAAMGAPIILHGQEIAIGVSVGIACAPDHGGSAGDLVQNADLALYRAKALGRGQVALFEIGMHEAMKAKRMIEMDLRAALGRDQFELHYQPLVNLESGEVTGYEALLRWHHPEQGMIMPAAFIPIAEETGLIVQIGEWVLRSALMEVARWPRHLSVSVNVSPAQMRSANLVPTIVNAIAASGVSADRLELEITESVLMHDTQANLAILHQLRSLGVRIALDDFGTGYSSLNYLRSFPFDKIKIDRCFVDEVDSSDDSRAIVRAVTGLASNLGMVTTAEGVERFDQLEELRREGCTEVQGYLLSRPMVVTDIAGRTAPPAPLPDNVRAVLEEKRAAAPPADRRARRRS